MESTPLTDLGPILRDNVPSGAVIFVVILFLRHLSVRDESFSRFMESITARIAELTKSQERTEERIDDWMRKNPKE